MPRILGTEQLMLEDGVRKTGSAPRVGSVSGPLTGLPYITGFVCLFLEPSLELPYAYVTYAFGLCLIWTQWSPTTSRNLGCGAWNPLGPSRDAVNTDPPSPEDRAREESPHDKHLLLYIILGTGGGVGDKDLLLMVI